MPDRPKKTFAEKELESAAQQFVDTMESTLSTPSEIGGAVGQVVIDVSSAAREFGGGIGELVAETGQKEFGDGIGGEAAKSLFGVLGEIGEAGAEVFGEIGATGGEISGNAIKAVGEAAGNLTEAGQFLSQGDFGGTVSQSVDAFVSVGKAGVGAVGAVGEGVVRATGELVEGGVEIGWEVIKGATNVGASLIVGASEVFSPEVDLFTPALTTARDQSVAPTPPSPSATTEISQAPGAEEMLNGEMCTPAADEPATANMYTPASDELDSGRDPGVGEEICAPGDGLDAPERSRSINETVLDASTSHGPQFAPASHEEPADPGAKSYMPADDELLPQQEQHTPAQDELPPGESQPVDTNEEPASAAGPSANSAVSNFFEVRAPARKSHS
ncbi:hypothetical protein GHK58_06505 [Sinorhizobium meliloti]|uniref:hypothetical protein n=1 Tax=Rhizobium meliloti TaxID=382 RepID=UPI00129568AB|nr:hypothetical protein [Sinorhizobium meliloti]MQX39886.1 hypothetical protein [Sinorhizobium meliloti]